MHACMYSRRRIQIGAYVLVVDALHEHQLSVRPFGMGLVLKGSTEFLNSDISLQDVVICRAIKKILKKNKLKKRNRLWLPFSPCV